MSDDFTPRYVGDTSRALVCAFTTHDGSSDVLTGASNLALHFRNRSTGATFAGQGSWDMNSTNLANGIAIYAWNSADVATPGFYDIQVSATLSDGPAHWDSQVIEIRAVF